MLRIRSVFIALAVAVTAARALVPEWTPPLSTRGRYVVDANGNRFKLKSVNWHGASGTWNGDGDPHDDTKSHANENGNRMALGLQYVHIDKILDSLEELGINSIRLPFSNDIIRDTNIVDDTWIAANPQLKGLTFLQVYDEVVKALTARRFAVILNNHTNKSRWCCGINDGNERWNASQDEESWIQDWVFMVSRYKDNKFVAGADLYNEVRRTILDDPNWGWGDSHDWYQAAQHAGDRILTEANSDVLIIIEGINWYGIPVDGFNHGRPTLTPARTLSNTLMRSDKLVYSAHFYGYTGPHHSGATGIGETTDARYRDFTLEELHQVYYDQASFVSLDKDAHYVRPTWFSEFGVGRIGSGEADTNWFHNTINYLIDNDLDFAYWPAIGYLENGNGNGWALQNWDKTGKRDGLYDGNDWRAESWTRLVNATNYKTGPVDDVPRWQMLSIDHEDYVKSRGLLGNDWDNGARKTACPDGLRLIGVSAGGPARGLCTNAGAPGTTTWTRTETVWEEIHVVDDWAGGHTKYQCPDSSFMVGYAVRGSKVSTVICGISDQPLGMSSSRTLWFDRGDDRGDAPLGGEFAEGQNKGQCQPDEYIAGLAFTTGWGKPGVPAAILCRK